MARQRLPLRPIEHGVALNKPGLSLDPLQSRWALNGRIDKGAFRKRNGYLTYKSPGDTVLGIDVFQLLVGTRFSMFLTDKNVCVDETGTGHTFTYINQKYTTGTVASMDGTKTIITGNGTTWNTTNLTVGDKFIINADWTTDEEPDTNWATIASIDGVTQITLSAAYTGASTSGAYTIRKLYSVPTNERWTWTILNNKFLFTNGAVNVQSWTGSGAATDLHATYATKHVIASNMRTDFSWLICISRPFAHRTR